MLYDFKASDSNQLSIRAGDIILWNDGELTDEWILCSYQLKVGFHHYWLL